MRLLDQVAQARLPCVIEDGRGIHSMRGTLDRAALVAECPLRYVLQPRVMQRCRALLDTDRAMFVRGNTLLRSPAPNLWLEWVEPEQGKVGLLVRSDDTGRAGTIDVYWEQIQSEPVLAQAHLHFDFDDAPGSHDIADAIFNIRHVDHPVARHLFFSVAPEWAGHLFASGQEVGMDAVSRICEEVLRDAEMLFAFSALLLHRPEINLAKSSLDRLNSHRRQRGKAELLDHVEVSLSLEKDLLAIPSSSGARKRKRLHVVRGHMVSRGDGMFWRRSHMRGDMARPIHSRTVTIS